METEGQLPYSQSRSLEHMVNQMEPVYTLTLHSLQIQINIRSYLPIYA
jgi:hypothetical protein